MKLNTARLQIRPIGLEDKDALFSYRSDPETNQYLSQQPGSLDDIEAFIKKSARTIDLPGSWFQLAIIEKESNQLIGDVGIHFLVSATENKQIELGYTLNKEFQRRGYATEALTSIIDYVFYSLKKHRITASIDPGNTASINLVERLGFRKEAHCIESLFFRGKWVDDVIYAILAREWKERKS